MLRIVALLYLFYIEKRFDGVAGSTSASHAGGPGFNPRSEYFLLLFLFGCGPVAVLLLLFCLVVARSQYFSLLFCLFVARSQYFLLLFYSVYFCFYPMSRLPSVALVHVSRYIVRH